MREKKVIDSFYCECIYLFIQCRIHVFIPQIFMYSIYTCIYLFQGIGCILLRNVRPFFFFLSLPQFFVLELTTKDMLGCTGEGGEVCLGFEDTPYRRQMTVFRALLVHIVYGLSRFQNHCLVTSNELDLKTAPERMSCKGYFRWPDAPK